MRLTKLHAGACGAALAMLAASTVAVSQTPPAMPPGGAQGPGAQGPGAAAPGPRPAFTPPAPLRIWAPKKTPYAAYTAPNKPWWKLSDVLAAHKGQQSWSHAIVRNKDIVADYHQIAPGQTTQEVAYPDNRTAIIVWSGEVRVSMAGQEPFVARKGFEIDVPFRVPFTLQAMGDQPALYFEIHATSDLPIYPVATTATKPKPVNGFVYEERLATGGAGTWDAHEQALSRLLQGRGRGRRTRGRVRLLAAHVRQQHPRPRRGDTAAVEPRPLPHRL